MPESGSRPYFHVTVQDPQKVGDAINAHIVYKVKTKVKEDWIHRVEETRVCVREKKSILTCTTQVSFSSM